jgi:hypothetical protein
MMGALRGVQLRPLATLDLSLVYRPLLPEHACALLSENPFFFFFFLFSEEEGRFCLEPNRALSVSS